MKVVIIGAGMHGLVANWVLSGLPSIDATVITRNLNAYSHRTLEFNAGPLRALRPTEQVLAMLDYFELEHSEYKLASGIMDKNGELRSFSKLMNELNAEDSEALHRHQFRRTRFRDAEDDREAYQAFSDAEKDGEEYTKTDFVELARKLIDFASPVHGNVTYVNEQESLLCYTDMNTGQEHVEEYDLLVYACPFWEAERTLQHGVSAAEVTKTSVYNVTTIKPEFTLCDSFYTPYLSAIHRVTMAGEFYSCEANTEYSPECVADDMEDLFGDDFEISSVIFDLKGYVGNTPQMACFASNVMLVGPYATWNQSCTLDDTMARCVVARKELLC